MTTVNVIFVRDTYPAISLAIKVNLRIWLEYVI